MIAGLGGPFVRHGKEDLSPVLLGCSFDVLFCPELPEHGVDLTLDGCPGPTGRLCDLFEEIVTEF
ncbi:MAG: hypothetical protein WCF90_02130 [Methanomicrobiales archaeon]